MVVTDFRPTAETCVWQARAGVPSRWMVHAPHSPTPQPYFVPTRPNASRSTHNIGVSDATSTEWVRPLTLRVYLLMAGRQAEVESPNDALCSYEVRVSRVRRRRRDQSRFCLWVEPIP